MCVCVCARARARAFAMKDDFRIDVKDNDCIKRKEKESVLLYKYA